MAYTKSNTTNVSFTDTSQSQVLSTKAKEVVLSATKDCYISFDSITVAASNGFFVAADRQYIIHILFPAQISVIRETDDGILSILELGDSMKELRVTYSGTITGDSNLKVEVSATVTGDANLKKEYDFTGDANLKKEYDFLGDANLKTEIASSMTGDASLKSVESSTITGDAFIITVHSASITGDTNLKKEESATITGDANLKETVSALAFNSDAKLVTS